MKLPLSIINLVSLCGENARYTIDGVMVKRDEDGTYLEATNGIIAMRAYYTDGGESGEVYVPGSVLRMMDAAFLEVEGRHRLWVTYAMECSQECFSIDGEGGSVQFRVPYMQPAWPDKLKKYFMAGRAHEAPDGKPQPHALVDLDKWVHVHRVVKRFREPQDAHIALRVTGAKAPVWMEFEATGAPFHKIEALLMPVSGD